MPVPAFMAGCWGTVLPGPGKTLAVWALGERVEILAPDATSVAG